MKSVGVKFGNDQISFEGRFDESSREMGWSKNEFSHSLALEPTPTVPSAFVALRRDK